MPTTRPVLPELPEGPGSPAPAADGVPQQLVDRYGRTVRDLRLSITDRCNLRCTYCMPAQGLQWLPTPDLLTTAELTRLGRIAVERLGVERIRLTGGEPLMRRDLEEIVEALSALRTLAGAKPDIALTTNGLGLEKRAAGLRAAGLDRVNISIDSLDPQDYAAITRRDRLADVLTGIAGAQEAGLDPIKVNAVAVPATVEERAPRLLAECLRRGWQLRFIEHMPLGPRETWSSQDVVGVDQILEVLREAGFTLTEVGRPDRRPAALWRVAAGSASGQERGGGAGGPTCAGCASRAHCDRCLPVGSDGVGGDGAGGCHCRGLVCLLGGGQDGRARRVGDGMAGAPGCLGSSLGREEPVAGGRRRACGRGRNRNGCRGRGGLGPGGSGGHGDGLCGYSHGPHW